MYEIVRLICITLALIAILGMLAASYMAILMVKERKARGGEVPDSDYRLPSEAASIIIDLKQLFGWED